ncbi:MAG: ABC transporter permease [Spirochaetales bacterium]|nr:ABC transporter permease [Spirochaetales bacterium]
MAEKKNTEGWEIGMRVLVPVAGVMAGLIIGALFLVILHARPFEAYGALLRGAVGTRFGITQTLVKATPLLLVGLGISIAFRASCINIGGEGQMIIGALSATWLALGMEGLPHVILIPLVLLGSMVAGGFWGFIPGILKAKFHVNEILSTIMLNSIALQLMNFLLQGPLMDPKGIEAGTYLAQSARLSKNAWLVRLMPPTLLHSGLFIALAMAVIVYVLLWRTTIGYRIRAVGLNPAASSYSGINVPVNQAMALTLAGALAGMAGAVEVLGVQHRLLEGLTSGYGFTGIVAALLGWLHPLGLIPASIFFGGLLVGADTMQRAVQVPSALIGAILGLIVLFVSASGIWTQHLIRRMRSRNQETTGQAVPSESSGGDNE